ncbi:hypothetical protein [Clostridium autoethanogenum]|uniref:hypothetical protein n=1 Tax=Clostridium autoethanogenum TaxID=84023 RepID=UPI0004191186|nr:hypothetical protein [Clostridium autoethanogenum]
MLKLKKKKKIEVKRKCGLIGRSPHDPDDLFWDEYGVYKKVYVNKFDKNRGNE